MTILASVDYLGALLLSSDLHQCLGLAGRGALGLGAIGVTFTFLVITAAGLVVGGTLALVSVSLVTELASVGRGRNEVVGIDVSSVARAANPLKGSASNGCNARQCSTEKSKKT